MKFLLYLICYCIYPFSFLFPRKKNRYAFGSFRGAFNDNAKYLFIYANECCFDREIAWVSANRQTVNNIRESGFRAYYTYSLKGALYALTSRYWFFNAYTSDIMFCLSGGATCINLWHGVGGLKRIEFNTTSGPLTDRYVKKKLKEVFYHPESFRRPDWFLSSTPFQTRLFATAFRIADDRCLEFGYPRNHILNLPEEGVLQFVRKYESDYTYDLIEKIRSYRKVFIYMPTWRDSQREVFIQNMNLKSLNEVLSEKGYLMLLKPHANTIVNEDSELYSNIIFIDSKVDIYPVLPFTDVLVTDYSSVLYDYILMEGKGVILYIYDYEEYVVERDFYYPFDENVLGTKIHSFEELQGCIRDDRYEVDERKRKELIERFWGKSAGMDSSAEIIRFIKNLN